MDAAKRGDHMLSSDSCGESGFDSDRSPVIRNSKSCAHGWTQTTISQIRFEILIPAKGKAGRGRLSVMPRPWLFVRCPHNVLECCP
jgi:hypothetical protein